jgi:predicted ATPase
MIRTIQIDAFKSLYAVTLELGRVNCFIGANGAGKSNILEALGILGAAANGVVKDEALLQRGVRPGLPRLYKTSFDKVRTPGHIGLGASGELSESYRVSLLNPLEKPEPAWSYKTELLFDGNEEIVSDGVRNKKNLNPKAGLAALKMVDLDPCNPAARLMERLQNYAIYSPNTPTLRGMVPENHPRAPVGLSGGQLAEGFAGLRATLGDEYDVLFDELLELIDWVADIDTTSQGSALLSPSAQRSAMLLKFTDRFMQKNRNELSAYDASEGALYVLFCALLCLSPDAPGFFAIDNLDQALNPRLVARLVAKLGVWLGRSNGMDQSVMQKQLLFTAHNPAVLDGLDLLDPEIRLFVVERNSEGHTCVRRVEMSAQLAAMNRNYPLSRLWVMGHLGAVPNV